MKSLLTIGAGLMLLGTTCTVPLPQRTKTFIPPTNERYLCQTDARFRYSPIYDFCWRYPGERWTGIQNTGPHDTGIPSVTANVFYMGTDQNRQNIFTLFVGPNTKSTRTGFAKDGITIVRENDRYVIGYQTDEATANESPGFAADVPDMLKGIYFFTPDGMILSE